MKKVSTADRKQGGNISRQTLTIGLDLGDRTGILMKGDYTQNQSSGSLSAIAISQECLARR